MKGQLRIDGVYDQETVNRLRHLGVKHFQFNFVPTSFNFLQLHKFLDILKASSRPDERYYLYFESEKACVLEKFREDLVEFLGSDNIFFEFSSPDFTSYYRTLSWPQVWHFRSSHYEEILENCPSLKGLVSDSDTLLEMHATGTLQDFSANFRRRYEAYCARRGIQLILKSRWDGELFPGLVQSLPFKTLALPVNSMVEIAYRQVDFSKIAKNPPHYENIL